MESDYNRTLGNFNNDNIIDEKDLNVLIQNWNYDVTDLNNMLQNWNTVFETEPEPEPEPEADIIIQEPEPEKEPGESWRYSVIYNIRGLNYIEFQQLRNLEEGVLRDNLKNLINTDLTG